MIAAPAAAPFRWTDLQSSLTRLLRWVSTSSAVLFLLVAAVLLGRRLAGALRQPLTAVELLAAGVLLAVVAASLRLAGQALRSGERPSRGDLWWRLPPAVAIIILGAALSLPGVSPWALMLFWVMLVAEESGSWLVMRRYGQVRAALETPRGDDVAAIPESRSGPCEPSGQGLAIAEPPAREIGCFPAEPMPPGVYQQITRARLEDGAEILSGLLRGSFAPGERSQSLHVAFCPPLEQVPAVKVVQISGPHASLKTAEARTYGVRLDLRLPEAHSEPVSVIVQLQVRGAAE